MYEQGEPSSGTQLEDAIYIRKVNIPLIPSLADINNHSYFTPQVQEHEVKPK